MTIQGLILAGGQGSRMGGVDKGLQLWRGQPLVIYPLNVLAALCESVLISCNRNLERYQALVDETVEDRAPDFQGPLSGLVSALDGVTSDWLLVSPCDTPLVTTEDFQSLLEKAEANPDKRLFALTSAEKSHPLHALIHRRLYPDIISAFKDGQRSAFRVFKQLGVEWVRVDERHMMNFNALEQLNE